VSAAAFDNTMLSVLLNPSGKVPCVPGTDTPVDMAKERAEGVVEAIEKDNRKIILPTPACAELLTAIGPDAQQYLNIVSRSRVFEVASFDARCAAELAILNRETFKKLDDDNRAEPYQKRKVDRQIIAICKVAGVTDIYTDDGGLANRAKLCGINPISISECAIPEGDRQIPLALMQHEAIPDAEEADDSEDRPAAE
jgi:hypothetical protein